MSVIKRSDLITDEAFKWPKDYEAQLDRLIKKSKELGGPTTKKNTTELAKIQNQLALATERSDKNYTKLKAATLTQSRINRDAVKDVQNLDNAYDKLSKELNDARKAYKNLAAQGKANTSQAKAQLTQIKKLDRQLKSIDNTVGQNQRSVGKYSDALKGVTARFLGWAAVAATLFRALRSGIKIILDYSKSNSTLNGILNKTSKETKELRKQQIALGKATAFSATQVTKAQIELSRLGLTMGEIIDLTPAILDGAVALGVDMADAAELVAGQLNAFNLSAKEGGRITDVLVRATQISAFNFERLKTALSVVSPAAQSVGISFERMTAILSAAVDANIDASTASTALRNIFIELANQGLTWEQAMTKINGSTDRLSTANELFGKRGAVVATVIANNTIKINENEKALNNAAGAAKKFADEQLDNLSGDIILLTSAWEGFILALETGDGVMATFTRGTLQFFASTLQSIARALDGITLETELWQKNIDEVNPDLAQLGRIANSTANDIKKITDELKDPGLFTNQTALAEELIQAEKRREFILGKIKAKIQEEKDEKLRLLEIAKKEEEVEKAKAIELQKRIDARIAKTIKLGEIEKKSADEIKEAILREIEDERDQSETLLSIEEKLQKDILAIRKRTSEAQKAVDERDAADAQLLADTKQAIIEKSFEVAGELGNRFTDLRLQQIQQELTAIEFARDRELEQAGDNERQKFEINKRFDDERKKLQRKQAITERANAIFQIALNTAIGIVNAASKVVTLPLIPFIVGIGAIQAAAVLAAPIPQFDEGKENTPKDYIAGEKRPELRKSKGKWSLVDKPTLFKNSPGDKIVSGKETDSILGNMADLAGHNLLTDQGGILSLLNNELRIEKRKDSDLAYILERNNRDLIRTIKNKKEVDIRVRNARVTERSGNQIIHRINYYYNR